MSRRGRGVGGIRCGPSAELGQLMELNEITGQIVGAALKVHAMLGPGLFEQVYRVALQRELKLLGLKVQSELAIPVMYDDVEIACGYRLDLLVESEVIVELKAVEAISGLHRKQLLTYLKLSRKQVGLLINFNTANLTQGLVRLVNGYRGGPITPHR